MFQYISNEKNIVSSVQIKKHSKYEIPFDSHLNFKSESNQLLIIFIPITTLLEMYTDLGERLFDKNIRSGLGGNFTNQKVSNINYPSDSNNYFRFNYAIDFRIGWEFVNEISKRWQVYYGLDTRLNYQHNKNDLIYTSNGYAYGSETIYNTFGISPVLGFRFKLNKRISLTTETNLSIDWSKSSRREYYKPYISGLPAIADEITPSEVRIYSQFSQPLSIILTFDI
jgi:hypothetical protein